MLFMKLFYVAKNFPTHTYNMHSLSFIYIL